MAKKAKKKSTNKQNKKPNNNQTAKPKAAQTSSSKAPQKAEQKQSKNNSLVWKVVAGVLAAALVTVSCLYIVKLNSNSDSGSGSNGSSQSASQAVNDDSNKDEAENLSLWTDEAPLKKQLTEYINTVTDKSSVDFIPVENRIAVFDMDGTLCCETDPGYFDHKLLYHRVMEDPNYKDKASAEEKEVASIIKTYFDTGKYPDGLDVRHGKAVASAFKGMTLDEFDAYVKEYRSQPMVSYTNMTNGEAFYKPMLQVIDLLQANDFTVYIISGTDRLITRGLVDGVINIPLSQMIGSDETLVADHQNGANGLEYQFTHDDKLVTGGEFVVKNLKMNKTSVIAKEIGVQPVLSFGNSSGDTSMANYTITNNKYKSAAYMLCCDDLERENGNLEKAQKMADSCKENGWTAVSMKNDWTTIYGEGVTYTGAAKAESATQATTAAATEAVTQAATKKAA